jgi:hypothetical protein
MNILADPSDVKRPNFRLKAETGATAHGLSFIASGASSFGVSAATLAMIEKAGQAD